MLASVVGSQIRAALDAEGSDRYRDDRDIIPAINFAIKFLTSIINRALGQNKISEEAFEELIYTRIFQANVYSRVYFNPVTLGHSLWSILGVYPKPVVIPTSVVPSVLGDAADSIYITTASFNYSNYSAKRLTAEQWNLGRQNPFVAGNVIVTCTDLIEYAYRTYMNSTSSGYTPDVTREIEIRPSVGGEFVGIEYLKVPTVITAIGNSIEFPSSMENLLVEKALHFISIKEINAEPPLIQVTDRDVNQLLSLMM